MAKVLDSMTQFEEIYRQIYATVQHFSTNEPSLFEEEIQKWRSYSDKFQNDNDYFETLVEITFHSGFKSTIACDRMEDILSVFGDYSKVKNFDDADVERLLKDEKMIRHPSKIRGTILNAREFHKLVSEFGSFKGYLDHHGFRTDAWDLKMERLFRNLKNRFHYLGPITTYHFLMDIGAWVIKPDRQVVALLSRLGLLDRKNVEQSAIDVCIQMAREADEKIRVVDIVLVNMGQGSDLGLEGPICATGCKHCQVSYRCKDSR